MSNNPRTESPTELAVDQNPLEHSAQKQPQQKDHEEEEDMVDVIDDLAPPFLVKTKTREEKENMRQQFRNQEANRHKKGTYHWIKVLHDKFTTSMLLDNKAATARDHLANERTFLAWLRTSLSLITVGVAITQLYQLSPSQGSPISHVKVGKSVGASFVVFSILFLYFANARYFHTQHAMTKGQFPASRGAVLLGSACIFGVLIAMFIIIILDLKH